MSISRARRSGIQTSTSPLRPRSVTEGSGLPSTVQNLSASLVTGVNSQATLSWSAPAIAGDSAITGYVVSTNPAGGSASVVGTSASVSSLSPGTQYTFTVSASNAVGRGTGGNVSASTTNWNEATGGTTITNVSNYNGSGETWRVHRFNSPGTFAIQNSANAFRYLVVGGGGGAGNGGQHGGGGNIVSGSSPFSTGNYVVNAVGAAGGGGDPNGGPGGNTTWHNFSAPGGNGAIFTPIVTPGSPCTGGTSSDITGSAVTYGACGSLALGNAGSGGQSQGFSYKLPGQAGAVFISYRVG